MSLELTGVHGLLKRHKLFTHKYNIEDSIETDNKVLNALDPQNYAKSDQRDQNIIPFTKIKRAGNLEKSTLSAL